MIVFKHNNSLVPTQKINSSVRKLNSEIKKFTNVKNYDDPYSFVLLPEDHHALQTFEAVISLKKKLNPQLIVVVGIGGSNLGAIAVQEAVLGKQYNLHNTPRILYADTVDPDNMNVIITEMQQHLRQGQNVLLNVISKSGTTTETIANFEVLLNVLKRHRKDAHKYVVATTDKGSKLWNLAIKNEYAVLEIPKEVGGRYSVFSSVGLFPLGMLGINIKELLKGASWMKQQCLNEKNNPAATSASIAHYHYTKKRNIHDHFLFATDLESLGKWHRQLLAESCGKNKKGITPTVSIGSTDLHSTAQLYLGGPDDKLTTFVATHFKNTVKVPHYPEYNALVPNLQKKELNQIMKAIHHGTEKTYKKNKKPYLEIHLPQKDEHSIGAFMQMKMMETIYLAKLLNVNPFGQPAVEEYKKETKKLLK